MPTHLYELRAADHLNNTGVSLLQRSCYRQAVLTFADAMSLIKIASSRPIEVYASYQGIAPVQLREEYFNEIQIKLRKAAQRLANPIPSTVDISDEITIKVVSDDESPTTFYRGCLTNAAHLLRVEPVESEAPSKHDLAVQSSVLLYNYGIAYRCLSSLSASVEDMKKLDHGALHLFNLSFSALPSRSCLSGCYIEAKIPRIKLGALLVLRHLVDLSHRLGFESERAEYSRRLILLCDEISRLEAIEGELSVPAAPVA
jgi:hypothetical protein